MRFAATSLALGLSIAPFMSSAAPGDPRCGGHQFLTVRRPETSCWNIAPQVFESPDATLRAVVFPADVSLDTTPDMESRIVIRSRAGDTVTSKDYSSARGMNGYYVHRTAWSPDSQFFVYSMMSSGGHSPWSFPLGVFARKGGRFVGFSDMIDGRPTLSGEFKFVGPHTLIATTWRQRGSLDDKVPVTVDLEAALSSLPPPPD